jgi:hypothetical protein
MLYACISFPRGEEASQPFHCRLAGVVMCSNVIHDTVKNTIRSAGPVHMIRGAYTPIVYF